MNKNLEPNKVNSCIESGFYLTLDKECVFIVKDLLDESYLNFEYVGETIENKAKALLTQYSINFEDRRFYAYLMREIMRNVVEHSGAKEINLKLYSNENKEFAFKVTDEGIGIKNSLNTNPNYNVSDNQSALAFSIRPGITKSWKRDPNRDEVWQNSGFGLYMVSDIIKHIGRFEIASGNCRLVIKDNFKEYKNFKIKGTEVLVVINRNMKLDVKNVIKEVSIKGNKIANTSNRFSHYAKVKTASKASTLI